MGISSSSKIKTWDIFRSTLAVCTFFALVACSSGDPLKATDTETTALNRTAPHATTNITGSVLAGHVALQNSDYRAASEYLQLARLTDPADPELALKALTAFAQSGQMENIRGIADDILAVYPKNVAASFARTAIALKAKAYEDALAYAVNIRSFPAAGILRPAIQAWASAGLGDMEAMTKHLNELESQPVLTAFAQMHRAMIGQYLALPTADRDLELAISAAGDAMANRLVRFAADTYVRRGDVNAARDILSTGLLSAPNNANLANHLNNLDHNYTVVGIPTPSTGVAIALQEIAAAFSRERVSSLSIRLLNWAAYLSPEDYRIHQMLSDLLYELGRYADSQRSAMRVPEQAPEYWLTTINRARATSASGDTDAAVAILRDLDKLTETRTDALRQLGFLLRLQGRYDESIEAYTRAINRLPQAISAHWALYYARGVTYQQSKQWPLAEKDLLTALELSPDHPSVLNYLGYSWVEQGRRLDEAFAMIEKAVEQRPTDGPIVDSLGWAHYMLGNYEQAVRYLERAIELQPDDPVINDHLGDAMWRVGREREARFQWRRALTFQPDDKMIALIEDKLENGLEG